MDWNRAPDDAPLPPAGIDAVTAPLRPHVAVSRRARQPNISSTRCDTPTMKMPDKKGNPSSSVNTRERHA